MCYFINTIFNFSICNKKFFFVKSTAVRNLFVLVLALSFLIVLCDLTIVLTCKAGVASSKAHDILFIKVKKCLKRPFPKIDLSCSASALV